MDENYFKTNWRDRLEMPVEEENTPQSFREVTDEWLVHQLERGKLVKKLKKDKKLIPVKVSFFSKRETESKKFEDEFYNHIQMDLHNASSISRVEIPEEKFSSAYYKFFTMDISDVSDYMKHAGFEFTVNITHDIINGVKIIKKAEYKIK